MAYREKQATKVHLIEWFDIESDAGWGPGARVCPTVHTVGVILDRPDPKDKIPVWRIASDMVETEPGGTTIIPACNVVGKPKLLGEYRQLLRTLKEKGPK